MFKTIFKELGLSENMHRLYVKLIESGPSSARQLAENLNVPRPSIYDNLSILIQKGLVVEKNEGNKKIFQVDDMKNLPRLVKEKMAILSKEQKSIEEMLPSLLMQTDSTQPRIKFYTGAEGVKQVLNDLLWLKGVETLSMWPVSEMIHVLGTEFFANFNRERIRAKISIRGIWPQNKIVKFKEHPYFGTGNKHLRELRLAPKGVSWNMGTWQYADKVAFISSRQETFAFVITSKDFAQWHKAQFEMMWKSSKPTKSLEKDTTDYLKTV